MTTLVVIPVLDEGETIGRIVRAARVHAPVLVVDDGSRDGSAAIARAAGAEVVRHPRRLGKGQAIRTGVAAARRRGVSLVVTLDGDGQHDPADLEAMFAAAHGAPGTVVIGNRLHDAHLLPPDRLNAIRVAGFFFNWASGLALEDTQSGFRAYPLALFDAVQPRRGGFVFETEVLVAAARRGWRIREIPVRTIPRAERRSRFRPLGDGVAIGAYLAGRVAARWLLEAGAAARALTRPFEAGSRRARHADLFQAAAPHFGSLGAWTLAIGHAQLHRAGASLARWWRNPRRRRAAIAARATLAAPIVLALLGAQALLARRDFTTALVSRLCSQARLDAPPPLEPVMALAGREERPS